MMMEELTFGLGGPEDAREVMELYVRCREGSDWDESYPTMEFAEQDLAAQSLYCLRDADGHIVAAITAGEEPEMDEDGVQWSHEMHRPCSLSRLCVDPALRSKGLAGELLRAVERRALELGYDGVRLWASRSNPAALALYRRMGYDCCGELHKYGTDFLCYQQLLR